jgi:DNA-directed RNA polymerase subunit RPC12/RpoP
MAKLRSVVLDVALDCPRCMRPVPLEAVRATARCRACGFEIAMPAKRWTYCTKNGVKNALGGEDGGRSVDFADGFTVVTRIRAGKSYDAPPAGAREADGLAKAIHTRAVAILGEREPSPIEAVEPVAFRCPRCGATAKTDGTARAIRCHGCGVEVDVPEALWDAIHPVRPRATPVLLVKASVWK